MSVTTSIILNKIDYYYDIIAATIITVIGVIGNTLVFYILSRPEFRNVSFFRYIIVETFFATAVVLFVWPYNLESLLSLNSDTLSCKLIQFIQYACYQFCSWIIVLSSVDRYMSVKYPTRYHFRNKIQYQTLALFICFCLIILTCVPYYKYYDVYIGSNNLTVCSTPDLFTGFYLDMANLFITVIIPFICMMLCTAAIAYHFFKSQLSLKSPKRFRQEVQYIRILIRMNLLFLICNLPYCIQLIIFDVYALHQKTFYYSTFIYDITNNLTDSYCALNFLVLFCFNKRFKDYFYKMIKLKKRNNQIAPVVMRELKQN